MTDILKALCWIFISLIVLGLLMKAAPLPPARQNAPDQISGAPEGLTAPTATRHQDSQSAVGGRKSAATLWKEYQTNEVAAKTQYQGKYVTISGTVYATDRAPNGNPRISFAVGHEGLQAIIMEFDTSERDNTARLIHGNKVNVIGRIKTYILHSTLYLDDCHLMKQED
ncbi:OB-fold protein [Nitratidesulfovibrio termitidis]|uniref:OB-fold protein n=1 Tax=Nitratidesulfovibrio termitidis TaxID=42252 RepID=UPI0018DB585E|nr:hypothetical protein [Nitratidesulfovibrio termitidis]